jgi:OHS family lactose permease-like MFS transporter
MKKSYNPWKFRASYFLHEFNTASYWSFVVVFLSTAGFTDSRIGVWMAIACVPSLFFNSINGLLCDKLNTIKKIFIPFYIVEALSAALFFWIANDVWMILFLVTTSTLCISTSTMIDSWVLQSSDENRKKYHVIFICNPLGYATGALAVGFLVEKLGYNVIPITFLALGAILLVFIFSLKDIDVRQGKTLSAQELEDTRITPAKFKIMLTDSRFILLIVMMTILWFCQYVVAYYAPLKILDVGGTEGQIGLFYSIPLYAELGIYFILERVMRHSKKIFTLNMVFVMVSASMLIVRSFLVGWADTSIIIIFVGVFQIFVTPIIMTAPKLLIFAIAPKGMRSTYQLTAVGIYINLSQILASLIGGKWCEVFGYTTAYYLVAAVAVAGLVTTLIFYKVAQKNNPDRILAEADAAGEL